MRLVRERHLPQQFRACAADRHGPVRPAAGPHPRRRQRPAAELRPPGWRTCLRRGELFRRRLGRQPTSRSRPMPDQTPIAPGSKVSDVTANGRRTARFVSEAPILTLLLDPVGPLCRGAADPQRRHLSVYYHRRHDWNVPRCCARWARPRLLPGQFRALSVRSGADHRVSRLRQLRPGLRQHHALFGIDRLPRRQG